MNELKQGESVIFSQHKSWNQKVINNLLQNPSKISKKAFRRIWQAIQWNNEFMASIGLKDGILNNMYSLNEDGVIYSIIDLRSDKIYIGQTINSAYLRFKGHRYGDRNKQSKANNLDFLMGCTSISNFMVWPLAKIPLRLYFDNDRRKMITNFRRIASIYERRFIHRLKTIKPIGLNANIAFNFDPNRRSVRPRRFDSRPYHIHFGHYCSDCIIYTCDDIFESINFHTHPGPNHHIRLTLNTLFENFRRNTVDCKNTIKNLSRRYIQKIKHFLLTMDKLTNHFQVREIIGLLQQRLNELYKEQAPKVNKEKDFIRIVYSSTIIRKLGLTNIFNMPAMKEIVKPPSICYKQVPSTRTFLVNTTEKSKLAADESYVFECLPVEHATNCRCRQFFKHLSEDDLKDGHVNTTNFEMMKNGKLKELFKLGHKFRTDYDPNTVVTSINNGLEEYVNKLKNVEKQTYTYTADRDRALGTWKDQILAEVNQRMQGIQHINNLAALNQQDRNYLQLLKDYFVISPCDKTPHNLTITCDLHYMSEWRTEAKSNTYEKTKKTYEEITKEHAEFNRKNKFKVHNKLPYMYGIKKANKKKKNRYIVGISDKLTKLLKGQVDKGKLSQHERVTLLHQYTDKPKSSLTELSIYLSKEFESVLDILKLKSNEEYKSTGLRTFLVIRKLDEFYDRFKAMQNEYVDHQIKTFDFTTLYTNLDHEKILNHLERVLQECTTYLFNMQASGKLTNIRIPDKKKLLSLAKYLISNTFIANDLNNILRQVIGLPMGTNCAPQIANLVLYSMESTYLRNLYNKGDESYKEYTASMRYIDDFISISKKGLMLPAEAYEGLQFSETTHDNGSFEYLGVFIWKENGRWNMKVNNKSDKFQFEVLKYTHFNSNAPEHQSIGIMMGQLMAYRRVCNSYKYFKEAVKDLVLGMLRRDHPSSKILLGWHRHLGAYRRDSKEQNWKLKTWFHRMLHWAKYEIKYPRPNRPNKIPTDIISVIQTEVMHAEATHTEEVPSGGIQAETIHTEEVPLGGIQTKVIQAETIHTEEVPSGGIQAEVIQAETVHTEEVPLGDIQTEVIQAETIHTKEVPLGDIQAEVIQPETVHTEEVPLGGIQAEGIHTRTVHREEVPSGDGTADISVVDDDQIPLDHFLRFYHHDDDNQIDELTSLVDLLGIYQHEDDISSISSYQELYRFCIPFYDSEESINTYDLRDEIHITIDSETDSQQTIPISENRLREIIIANQQLMERYPHILPFDSEFDEYSDGNTEITLNMSGNRIITALAKMIIN